jgi:hypothetical protein
MPVILNVEASLSERTSGASFEITARDQQHARQIAAWLRSVVKDKSSTFITARQVLPLQSVGIELPEEPDELA